MRRSGTYASRLRDLPVICFLVVFLLAHLIWYLSKDSPLHTLVLLWNSEPAEGVPDHYELRVKEIPRGSLERGKKMHAGDTSEGLLEKVVPVQVQLDKLVTDDQRQCLNILLNQADAIFVRNRARQEAALGQSTDDTQASAAASSPHAAVINFWRFVQATLSPIYPCLREERLGGWGPGGFWICSDIQEPGAALPPYQPILVGVSGVSTAPQPSDLPPEVTHKPVSCSQVLGSASSGAAGGGGGGSEVSLRRILDTLGGLPRVAVLSFACPGLEAGLAEDLGSFPRGEPPFGQLVLQVSYEVSDIQGIGARAKALVRIEGLGFRMFHSEPCGSPAAALDAAQRCYMLSYVHESLVTPNCSLAGLTANTEGPLKGPVCSNTVSAAVMAKCTEGQNARIKRTLKINLRQRSKMIAASVGTPLVLAPVMTCPLKERFGWWDSGAAWVCQQCTVTESKETGGWGAVQGLVAPRELVVTIGGNSNSAGSPVIGFEDQVVTSALMGGVARAHVFNPAMNELHGGPNATSETKFYGTFVGEASLIYNSALTIHINHMTRVVRGGIEVLRIDCEGCEYGLVRDLRRYYKSHNVPFSQVCIQMHGVENLEAVVAVVSGMEALGYASFHVEQDGYDQAIYELSFLHTSCL